MSGNVDKTAWPMWLWLLHGTVFASFWFSVLLASTAWTIYCTPGIFFLGGGVFLFWLPLCVLGFGLLFATWCWKRWFFRQIAAKRCPQSRFACLLPFFLPIWYIQAVGTVFFVFPFDTDLLLLVLFPYFSIIIPAMDCGGALSVFCCAITVACLTALLGGCALVRTAHGMTGWAWDTSVLLAITAVLAIICAAGFGQYQGLLCENF